jgi:hypothetical protein
MPPKLGVLPATSAPYFDHRCGIVVKTADELHDAVVRMSSEYVQYSPREYVAEHLNLQKTTGQLLSLFEEFCGNAPSEPPPQTNAPFRLSLRGSVLSILNRLALRLVAAQERLARPPERHPTCSTR